MLLGGLWHGSSWNFVIWGGIHGVVLSIEKYLKKYDLTNYLNSKIINLLGLLITFTIVVFSWIFFRSQSINNSFVAIKNLLNFSFQKPFIGDINIVATGFFVLTIGILIDVFLYKNSYRLETIGSKYSTFKVASIVSVVIILIALFYSSSNNFIYFQF
jgi:D-alanyl-lipoteichoic acid acyltransferase DltB (MBOAT superfamily)